MSLASSLEPAGDNAYYKKGKIWATTLAYSPIRSDIGCYKVAKKSITDPQTFANGNISPYLTTTCDIYDTLSQLVSFIYSSSYSNTKDNQIKVLLARFYDNSNIYYHCIIESLYDISLDYWTLDTTGGTSGTDFAYTDIGGLQLLMGGSMQNLGTAGNANNVYYDIFTTNWNTLNSLPYGIDFNDAVAQLKLYVDSVNGGNVAGLTYGEYSYFDSVGVSDSIAGLQSNPNEFIAEILDGTKHLDYLVTKYSDIFQSYSENAMELFLYGRSGYVPFIVQE